MRATKYGRNVPKDRTYRAHKRNALAHFQTRWSRRLRGIKMPNLDVMREHIRRVVSGGTSPFFTLHSRRDDSTRVAAHIEGKDIIISYDHTLKVPVTVWEKRDYDREYEQALRATGADADQTLP